MRFVGGARGDLDFMGRNGWTWDASVQFSRSDGDYKTDIIWDDAITPYQFQNTFVQTGEPHDSIPGHPVRRHRLVCPEFLERNFTAAEKAFLFRFDQGQYGLRGDIVRGLRIRAADATFQPVMSEAVIGFDYQDDRINDIPAQAIQNGWAWGDSQAG